MFRKRPLKNFSNQTLLKLIKEKIGAAQEPHGVINISTV